MHTFLGWRERTNFLLGGFYAGRIFTRRGQFSGSILFKGSFALREFARIPIRNFFLCLASSLSDSVLGVEMLMVIVRDKFSPGFKLLFIFNSVLLAQLS